MGPDELDDLLASIRAEGKKESALALYEGTREEDLVDENIDERVLKLLGLNEVFDIDYGTYVTLLKERLAASRSFGKKLSTEEDELLVEEFRKVKGKVGRFKIKRKKITAENISVTGPVKVSTERFYLTSKAIIPQPAISAGGDSEDVKDISEALDELLKSIIGQNKEEKKKAEESRKEDEQKRRVKRESELEKPIKKALGLVKKIVAPFQSILDRIMKFIQFTFIGFLVDKVLKWFADPANEKKVKILGRFLKDWWPSLLAAYVLFATPFGKFVRGTLKLLRGFIPQMVRFMAAHPTVFPIVAATVGGIAKIKESERMKPLTQKSQAEIDKTLQSKDAPWYQKLGASFAGQSLNAPGGPKNPIGLSMPGSVYSGGGKIRKDNIVNVRDIAFDGGGGISDDSGLRVTGAGPDTQLIAAQPGEVMMSKKAVDKYGANFFLGLNKRAGGTNIPRMVNNIQLAQGGGMIGKTMNFLGGLGLPNTGSVMAPNYTGMGYQNKFLGINLNRVNLPQIPGRQFSQSEVQRYNQSPTAPSTIRNWSPYDPVQVSVPKTKPSTPISQERRRERALRGSLNFAKDMQKIPGASGVGSGILQDAINLGERDLKNQLEMERQIKQLLGPQSRAMPVGTPTIISRSQTIVLPPQTMLGKKPSVPVKTGTQIPDVSTVARIPHREMVIQSLGIGDLMGVG